VKISLRAPFLAAVALLMLYLGQIVLGGEGKFLIERFRTQSTRTKTPVLAIIFGVPMTSLSPYLNPHTSAESWRIKSSQLILSQSKEQNPQQAEQGHAQMQQCL
jgi:hypothetical protein